MAPEGDLCRSADLAELRLRVVGHHCVGLLDERVDRLRGAAAHEVGQSLDVIRFLRVQLRSEAPWEDQLKQIYCRPWTLSGLSLKLIESHYENNYGGALRRLNAIS